MREKIRSAGEQLFVGKIRHRSSEEVGRIYPANTTEHYVTDAKLCSGTQCESHGILLT